MENRKPAVAEATPAMRGNRVRGLLLAAGVLVIFLVLVSVARLSAPGDAGPWRTRGAQTVGQSAPAVQADADHEAPHAGPARIIDAAAASLGAGAAEHPLAAIKPARETIGDTIAKAPTSAGSRPAAPPGAARPRPAAMPVAAPRDNAKADNDSNLISTLLGIIRQDGGAAAEPSSMDSLVARILAENERTYSETSAALASLGEAPPATDGAAGPSRAQRELQACPAANTVQGINCRDRICARWAGRDPACPAR